MNGRNGTNRIRKIWKRIVFLMSCIVVFAVTYALILPAITLNEEDAASEPGIALEELLESSEEPVFAPSGESSEETAPAASAAQGEGSSMQSEPNSDDTPAVVSPEAYPPHTFRKELDGLTVVAEAAEGALPADTIMTVSPVPAGEVLDAVQDGVENRIAWVQAVDITFHDAEGRELQPLIPIRVSITLDELEENSAVETEVVHVDDDGTTEIVEQAPPDRSTADNTVVFDADTFSIYAIVGTVIEENILLEDGSTYKISVTYGPDAQVPAGARLEAEEIKPGSDTGDTSDYARYVSKAEEALGWRAGSASWIRIFDIRIVDENGEKVEIAAPVGVKIELLDKDTGAKAAANTHIVHFADGAEKGDVLEQPEVNGTEVSFKAEGFSAYAIVEGPGAVPVNWHTVTSVEELISLGNEGVYICHPDGYYFGNTLEVKDNRTGIAKIKPAQEYPGGGAALYYFEHVEGSDNQYYAYCYASDGVTKQYVRNNNDKNLTFAQTESGKTAFTVTKEADGTFSVRNGAWYWNMQGGASGTRFCSWNAYDANSKVQFWYYDADMEDDPYGLDGKTYGLMDWNGDVAGKAVMAEIEGENGLYAKSMTVMTKIDNSDRLFVPNDSTISMWTFHWDEEDRYFITTVLDGSTKYLKIDGTGLHLVSDIHDTSSIQIVPGTGIHAGEICLKSNGTVLTYSGHVADGFSIGGAVGNEWLYLVELSELTQEYFMIDSARKVSVSDPAITNGSRVIVYTRYWNEEKLHYDYYAINSDGTLVPVYEKGDSIEWVSGQINTLLWNFVEYYWEGTNDPNYFYELYNQYSEEYIAPQVTGSQILSPDTIGINLNGRRDGRYYSTIVAWDEDAFAYVGLKVEDGHIVTCPMSEAMDFYFAVMQDLNVDDDLTTVPTVDNREHGITMKIVDLGTRAQMSAYLGSNEGGLTTNLVQGLLSTDLKADGYPTTAGGSLGGLYAGEQDVNHLFILSTYNGTGYFEYDSTQNFATLGGKSGGDFTVYKELGTYDGVNRWTVKHGQFFPFNDLKPGVFASVNSQNLYSLDWETELDEGDPRKYEKLYSIEHDGETVNTQFALELEASFTQTANGLDAWGHDIIFEFTGDDDFWLYVDGELVIDLGGIHSAVPGDVNFRTGVVHVNGTETTLKDLFYNNYIGRGHTEAEAQAYIEDKFRQNSDGQWVFKDYTSHSMKIFYMERGAGASNLHMRFNLSAVKKGTALLHKELAGIDGSESVLAEFPYQIYYTLENGTEHILTNALAHSTEHNEDHVFYQDTVNPVKFREELTIDGITYRDVFLLKPDETAEINFPEGTVTYRIVECGVNTDVYTGVAVNGEAVDGMSQEGYADNREDFGIGQASTDERPRVNYVNEVNPDALKTLTIDKLLFREDGETPLSYEDDPTVFTFRLYLAPEFENLDLANMHTYHVKDPDGNYCVWDAAQHKFVKIGDGKTDYDALTDAEKTAVSFTTSIYGTISNVQVGYTIEIRNVLAGMQFRIQERSGEIPDGYSFQKYIYNGNESDAPADEGITDIVDAAVHPHVDVCNLKGWGLRVRKAWSDAGYMSEREPAYFAVFVKGSRNSDPVLIEEPNTVRRLAYDEDPQTLYWYFEHLPVAGTSLEDYVIREVTISGTDPQVDENGAVTGYGIVVPLENGDEIGLDGRQKGENETSEFTYTVTNSTGETGEDSNVRVDTVTNSRPGIVLRKAEWDGVTPLAGAHFTLRDEDGTEIGAFVSDADGLITVAFLRDDADYSLTETSAPAHFQGLPTELTIRVHNGVITVSGADEAYYLIDNAAATATLTVKNRPYTFAAVKKDRETGEVLPGVTFALHRQVTVDGVTAIDLNPMPGHEVLVTDENGVIPLVDDNLPPGTYELRETQSAEGYPLPDAYTQFTISPNGSMTLGEHPDGVTLTEEADADGTICYVLTIPNSRRKFVRFKKVDIANVADSALEGAMFDLYGVTIVNGVPVQGASPLMTGLTSGPDGILADTEGTTVFELPIGFYHLVETDAPPGYNRKPDPVLIAVTASDVTYDDGTNISGDGRGKSFDASSQVYTLKISDSTGAELPATGGGGTKAFPLAGGLMLGLSAAVLLTRRRRYTSKGGGPGP